jgi:6-phosphogluconolactonase
MAPLVLASHDTDDWAAMASREIIAAIQDAIAMRGVCSLMLTGGNTAKKLYEHWEKSSFQQKKDIHYYFGDERCVPPQHAESNYGSFTRTLWPNGIPDGILIVRMKAECANAEIAALEYENTLPSPVDVLLLGMGSDGHVASLFPGHSALRESDRSVVFLTGPTAPHERMSITPKVIRQARRIFLLAVGAEKGRILAEAMKSPAAIDSLPVRLALKGTWLLDQAALSQLQGADFKAPTCH